LFVAAIEALSSVLLHPVVTLITTNAIANSSNIRFI
jgi:hypothetical protein